jgi:hypothetical protein
MGRHSHDGHASSFAARERAYADHPRHEPQPRPSPFALDATAIVAGITVGVVALLVLLGLFFRHGRTRPNCASSRAPHLAQAQRRSCTFRNACPAASRPPRKRHPLNRLAGKLPWPPPRARTPTCDLPDETDEELAILKSHEVDEEAGAPAASTAPADGGQSESDADEASLEPQPLPQPAALEQSAPPPLPHYSRLELRQLEADGDTVHCWAALPAAHTSVRAADYLRDGLKAQSEPFTECLACELFRTDAPIYNVAARPDSPAHTLARRSAPAIASVLVVNLIIPATDGFYHVRTHTHTHRHSTHLPTYPPSHPHLHTYTPTHLHTYTPTRLHTYPLSCDVSRSSQRGTLTQVVFYFGLLAAEAHSPAGRLYERFVAGSDAFRHARFKLIPSVAEGPWLVKTGVGNRPSILGKSLKQRFAKGDGTHCEHARTHHLPCQPRANPLQTPHRPLRTHAAACARPPRATAG